MACVEMIASETMEHGHHFLWRSEITRELFQDSSQHFYGNPMLPPHLVAVPAVIYHDF
jgi:hypothetical protein